MKTEEYKYKSDQNVQTIESQLSILKEKCHEFDFRPKPFWDYVKTLNSSFKTLKPIDRNERERLWSKFQGLCEKAKSLQKDANDKFKYQSKESKSNILYYIKEAGLWKKENYSKAQELMGKAMKLMKSSKLTKDDRECCWEEWKRTKDNLTFAKNQERKNNYLIIKEKIVAMSSIAAYYDPKDALKEIKNIQGMLRNYPMDDVYWKEVQESLQRYWNMAQGRLDEHYRQKQRDWESKQAEYREKKARWRQKQEDALDRFINIISKNEDYIDRLRSQIDDLEDKMWDGSDSFKSRASGWVSEKQDKIRDIQNSNSDLEDKIRDIRRQLNE